MDEAFLNSTCTEVNILLTTELERQVANGNTYDFMWLTAEQYAKYVGNTQMTTIPGKSMLLTWSHWIVSTTLHDALTTAAYQLSCGQTTTGNMNCLHVIALKIAVVNMGYAVTADEANVFNRGGVLTQFQLCDNYELSTSELVSQSHLQMNGQWSNIFSTYCWNHNFI